jgi:small subunit ribosomal protein S2
MGSLPQAIFIVDPGHSAIAIAEARKLKVPVIAITDSNCDPTHIDHPIPGNDDAIRSIRLITSALADACLHGIGRRRDTQASRDRETTMRGPGGSDTVVYQARRPPQPERTV